MQFLYSSDLTTIQLGWFHALTTPSSSSSGGSGGYSTLLPPATKHPSKRANLTPKTKSLGKTRPPSEAARWYETEASGPRRLTTRAACAYMERDLSSIPEPFFRTCMVLFHEARPLTSLMSPATRSTEPGRVALTR